MAVTCCNTARAARVEYRRRRRRSCAELRTLYAAELSSAAGGDALLAALIEDGMALLVPSDSEMAARTFSRCISVMDDYFARPEDQKRKSAAGPGPGCQVGYMINAEGGAEMFEAKCAHDPRWPWPDEAVRGAVGEARTLLCTIAMACLRALARPLGLAPHALESLLDGADPPLATCSNTTMRVWRYWHHGVGNELHCDNSLLTVAPRGTQVGLHVRRFSDGYHVQPEAHMAPGTMLVFAGDALGLLTHGRVPALVHWVSSPSRGEARISLPFFLRPRLDALLDCQGAPGLSMCQRELEAAGKEVGSVRTQWPWKASNRYYHATATDVVGSGIVSPACGISNLSCR